MALESCWGEWSSILGLADMDPFLVDRDFSNQRRPRRQQDSYHRGKGTAIAESSIMFSFATALGGGARL